MAHKKERKKKTNLCWIVNPLQRHIGGNHGQQVGEGTGSIVDTASGVLALVEEKLPHFTTQRKEQGKSWVNFGGTLIQLSPL